MIPLKVLQNVFFIQYGNGSASSFTVEKNEKQYLVTARHLFISTEQITYNRRKKKDASNIYLYIFRDDKWNRISGKVFFHENLNVDIAVIELPKKLLPINHIQIDPSGLGYGQDVYFLGFPLGFKSLSNDLNPYPFPLVKKAVFAGLKQELSGALLLYLDGQTNEGFSGGPIIFRNMMTNKFQICAIMTAALLEIKSYPIVTEDTGITLVTHISQLDEILDQI